MRWSKIPIAVNDVPKLINELESKVKNGVPGLENFRVAFSKEDSSVIYLYTIFDLLDNKFEIVNLKNFYFYQPNG